MMTVPSLVTVLVVLTVVDKSCIWVNLIKLGQHKIYIVFFKKIILFLRHILFIREHFISLQHFDHYAEIVN